MTADQSIEAEDDVSDLTSECIELDGAISDVLAGHSLTAVLAVLSEHLATAIVMSSETREEALELFEAALGDTKDQVDEMLALDGGAVH